MTYILDNIAQNVEKRGYFDGWTRHQIFARNICKALEELAEASRTLDLRGAHLWRPVLLFAGWLARRAFDNKNAWNGASIKDGKIWDAIEETGDVQVTLACAFYGLKVNGVKVALGKSVADIGRGVRK